MFMALKVHKIKIEEVKFVIMKNQLSEPEIFLNFSLFLCKDREIFHEMIFKWDFWVGWASLVFVHLVRTVKVFTVLFFFFVSCPWLLRFILRSFVRLYGNNFDNFLGKIWIERRRREEMKYENFHRHRGEALSGLIAKSTIQIN